MPVNDTGRPLIHKGQGNRIIHPGDWYDGPEVGPDGDYSPRRSAPTAAAPASPTTAPVPSRGEPLPARSILHNLNKVALADLARARHLPVPEDLEQTTRRQLQDLLESTRGT